MSLTLKRETLMEKRCEICPRGCRVDRQKNLGFCREKNIRIAKIIRHFSWEEPCLADERGTLAIFFSGCNLGCDYCQNYEISSGGVGENYSIQEFCDLIEKEQQSHSSIDLITPTHFSSELIEAFKKIDKKVPVIWNTSSYETVENIKNVSAFVDVFLADLKYADDMLCQKFSRCDNYFSFALPAIKQMCKKEDIFENDLLKQGVIIRHLVLPGYVKNSLKVLDVISENFKNRIISVMSQFTPNGRSVLDRKITAIEYKTVLSHMEKLHLEKGFLQDFDSANENFVPKFV